MMSPIIKLPTLDCTYDMVDSDECTAKSTHIATDDDTSVHYSLLMDWKINRSVVMTITKAIRNNVSFGVELFDIVNNFVNDMSYDNYGMSCSVEDGLITVKMPLTADECIAIDNDFNAPDNASDSSGDLLSDIRWKIEDRVVCSLASESWVCVVIS